MKKLTFVILVAFAICVCQTANANNQHEFTMPTAAKEIPALSEQDKARFFSHVQIGEIDQCWNWQLAPRRFGYGGFKIGGRNGLNYLAHRVSFFILTGSLEKEICVLHKCDNTKCVNPNHLFVGTKTDNNKDRHSKGRSGGASGDKNGSRIYPDRMTRGINHPSAKLNDNQVGLIRRSYPDSGESMQAIADRFGVSKKTVLNVIHGKIWKHV